MNARSTKSTRSCVSCAVEKQHHVSSRYFKSLTQRRSANLYISIVDSSEWNSVSFYKFALATALVLAGIAGARALVHGSSTSRFARRPATHTASDLNAGFYFEPNRGQSDAFYADDVEVRDESFGQPIRGKSRVRS